MEPGPHGSTTPFRAATPGRVRDNGTAVGAVPWRAMDRARTGERQMFDLLAYKFYSLRL